MFGYASADNMWTDGVESDLFIRQQLSICACETKNGTVELLVVTQERERNDALFGSRIDRNTGNGVKATGTRHAYNCVRSISTAS